MTIAALIDGDIIAYKHASAAEVPCQWTEDLWTLHAHASPAKAAIDDEIERLANDVGASTVVVAVSDPGNFRKELYPEYKANRTKRPPIILRELKAYLVEEYQAYSRPNLEADDILGILATHSTLVRADLRVIVSIDKDFLGVPAALWNWNATPKGIKHVSRHEADRWHLIQTLTGDTTDNYPGCPGIGPVKAAALVDKALASSDPWPVIVEAFVKAGLTEADALLQARLARILRADEYDFKAKRPKLWRPEQLLEPAPKPAKQKTK